ncbi:MAG: metallophosphoesterase [Myxococcota bacterium]
MHLSDLHATEPSWRGTVAGGGKRWLGALSWWGRRRRRYRPEVLEALLPAVEALAPEQIVVTGDLTQLGLPGELAAARGWLERLGPTSRVLAVPGNHDATAATPDPASHVWDAYLRDPAAPAGEAAFPSIREVGEISLVGLCTAVPTALLDATGHVGAAQLARLEATLERLGRAGRTRVVAMHHPPESGVTHRRRALHDGAALRGVLRRVGAELVLHGHLHRTHRGAVAGPNGPIPVVGVASASRQGGEGVRRGGFHTYDIETQPGGAPRIAWRTHRWDAASRRFEASRPERL